MKWLGGPSPFPLFTNPCVINRFIFGQEVVIYYISSIYIRYFISKVEFPTKYPSYKYAVSINFIFRMRKTWRVAENSFLIPYIHSTLD